jgi:gamma-glutamyl-gamma-aminobutyrate hydrolase PuuD
MTRPLIGITSEMTAARWGDRVREAVLLPASYAWALQRAGCVPVLLPPTAHDAAALAARLDAVAWTDDQAVAAIELTGHSFALGMRWHPGDYEDMRIFKELVAAASNRAGAA